MNRARKIITIIALTAVVLTPVLVLGGDWDTDPPVVADSPDQLFEVLSRVRNFLFAILGVAIVLMLLYAAYEFITASGNETKISKGRDMVKYALIGVVIMLLAGGIFGIVQGVLGV